MYVFVFAQCEVIFSQLGNQVRKRGRCLTELQAVNLGHKHKASAGFRYNNVLPFRLSGDHDRVFFITQSPRGGGQERNW